MFSLGPWKSRTPHKLWGRVKLVELHILIRCETYYFLFLLWKVRTEIETCFFYTNIHFYSHKKEKQNGFRLGLPDPNLHVSASILSDCPVNKPTQFVPITSDRCLSFYDSQPNTHSRVPDMWSAYSSFSQGPVLPFPTFSHNFRGLQAAFSSTIFLRRHTKEFFLLMFIKSI